MRYTDRDGGVTEGKTTKYSKNGGMEGQTSTIHAVNRETDDMMKVGSSNGQKRGIEWGDLPGDCDLSRGLGGVGGFWVSPAISSQM